MGSLQLDCPLCCTETFTCLQSLKYHLLSIIDNILCPSCGSRFSTILELADHLDNECGKTSEKSAADSESSRNIPINIKIENEDSSDETLNNSILAKALLSPQSATKNAIFVKTNANGEATIEESSDHIFSSGDNNEETMEMENDADTVPEEGDEDDETQEENQDQEVYSCLSCGMNFTSLIDHIQDYHAGEEVVVEMTEENQDSSKDGSDILKNISEGAAIISEEGVELSTFDDEEDMGSNGSQDVLEVGGRGRMPQILNTIKQEDCIDKDGRLYTRKVVQIEKFWDDNSTMKRMPIVLKYIYDSDGTLTKYDSGDEVADGTQIIEINQCTSCNVQFPKREQFDAHVCEPEIGSEYKCSMCDSSFTNSQTLCSHMRSHKKIKTEVLDAPPTGPFVCNVCDTVFPSNKSLRLHRRMHDPIKAKEIDAPVEYGITGSETGENKVREMFECKVCGKNYDKSYEEIHMAYHSGVNHYDCYICNRKFYTRSNLAMHMRVHGSEKGHLCSHCKKGFMTEESLQQHLKQHCSSRPYQCSYCSRRFARPHEKVKHERIHTGEKPHECEICGKTFRVSYCLTLHMRTHSGYRPYVCQHCGKRFKAHSVYNHHLLTHSDVRGYKCPYCPKAFKTGVQLAGHKNSHTKPFSCTECNRPFASLYAVRAHMETHKRENNLKYNCYLCGASYARAFALRDHIKEVHVDAPQNGSIALDIIEEGMEASTSILPDNDDISMVTLEMSENVSEIEDEVSRQ